MQASAWRSFNLYKFGTKYGQFMDFKKWLTCCIELASRLWCNTLHTLRCHATVRQRWSLSECIHGTFPLMTAEAKCQQFASHFPISSFSISHFLVPTFRVILSAQRRSQYADTDMWSSRASEYRDKNWVPIFREQLSVYTVPIVNSSDQQPVMMTLDMNMTNGESE